MSDDISTKNNHKIPSLTLVDVGNLPAHQNLLSLHLEFLAAATSDNTRRTYRSAIRHFLNWGGVLPSDTQMLMHYLLAHSQILNPRTLALRLTALSQWHVQQGFPDPSAAASVRKTLVGIERIHGKPKKKAKALAVEDLDLIIESLTPIDTLQAKRDSALLQLGFFGGYRRSEICNLQVSHLRWEPEGLVLTLQRSKTDQMGQGIVKAIPYGDGTCCPVSALRAWLTAAEIQNGPLFRRVNKWGQCGSAPLHPSSINTILSACAKRAGLTYVPELSSHSLRRGMATSAHRAGVDFRDIKRQGGWRHDGTVQGYIEEAGQFEKNAAGTLLNRRKSKS